MSRPTTEAALRFLVASGHRPTCPVARFGLSCNCGYDEVHAALRERPSPPEGADIDRMNNAADLIRRLLGYDGEPDESTAGMIYDAIEGDEDAFRAVIALRERPSDAALVKALERLRAAVDTENFNRTGKREISSNLRAAMRTADAALAAARPDVPAGIEPLLMAGGHPAEIEKLRRAALAPSAAEPTEPQHSHRWDLWPDEPNKYCPACHPDAEPSA